MSSSSGAGLPGAPPPACSRGSGTGWRSLRKRRIRGRRSAGAASARSPFGSSNGSLTSRSPHSAKRACSIRPGPGIRSTSGIARSSPGTFRSRSTSPGGSATMPSSPGWRRMPGRISTKAQRSSPSTTPGAPSRRRAGTDTPPGSSSGPTVSTAGSGAPSRRASSTGSDGRRTSGGLWNSRSRERR
ncbi:MAG: hypothetical protein BWX50_01238 [Euryarchaeota archaeon ADurb.Bin009]|nr:MAG: hypothetical protein BWX50_01238 [Euryarchaeota archaeon ADurb.Bin009]